MLEVVYARMSDHDAHGVQVGSMWQVDYSLRNSGESALSGVTLDLDLLRGGEAYGTRFVSGLSTIEPGQTVEWCHLARDPLYNDGEFTVRLHFHDAEHDYGSHDVAFTVVAPERHEEAATGSTSISVGYARMSDHDAQGVQVGSMWQVDYSLTNDGDTASNPLGLAIQLYRGSEPYLDQLTSGLSVIEAGQTVEWCYLARSPIHNDGDFTARLHFYDSVADYGSHDVAFTVVAPERHEEAATGSTSISVGYARMSASDANGVQLGSLWQVDYSLTNDGDTASNPLGLAIQLYRGSEPYLDQLTSGLSVIEAGQTVEWCYLARSPIHNDGDFTARLHFYDSVADYGTHDVAFTVHASGDG